MPAWIKRSFDGFEQRSLSDPPQRFARSHDEPPEVFVVVGGSGHARLDDDRVPLAAWDVLRVAAGVRRAFEAGPDGLQMICMDESGSRVRVAT